MSAAALLPADRRGARADFLDRARHRLLTEPLPVAVEPVRGDHQFDADETPSLALARPKPAAVLIPVVLREEATVLLTERAASLRQHSGQIALPGGRLDADETPLQAALREAEEEIGLRPALVTPLGYLDPYLSVTNYLVTPVVAAVEPGFVPQPNADEVAAVFEVPLAFLMDDANHQVHAREWRGRERRYYAMPFGDHYIWGVTAGILRGLYERIYGGPASVLSEQPGAS